MKKRVLAALLAAMMLALSACSEKAAEDTSADGENATENTEAADGTTAEGTSSEDSNALIDVEDNYDWKAGVDKNDYGGYTFTILNGCTATWYSYTNVTVEEATGEPVNDAVFERTQRTNELLNVNVVEDVVSDSMTSLQNGVKAGTNDFDVGLVTLMNGFTVAQGNYILDLNSVSGLHLDEAWWDQNANEDLEVNGKLYFTTSDFDTTRFDSIRSLFFNKQLFTDMGLENPYTLVDEGTWTLDKFIELVKKGTADLDGDGVMTDADRYGYVTYNEIAIDMLLRGSNIRYIDKDPETGHFIDGTSDEKLVDTYGKIYSLLMDGNDVFDVRQTRYSSYLRGLGDRAQEALFTEDKALFYSECLAWSRAMREMESDFGVLPPPKYDEQQERHYSIILNPFMQMIPVTAEDSSRTANIIDVLAAASHDTVVDAYVNVTLGSKIARDTDTVRMLRLVFDELSYNIHSSSVNLRSIVVNGISGGSENITSLLQKSAKATKKQLEKFNESFFGEE